MLQVKFVSNSTEFKSRKVEQGRRYALLMIRPDLTTEATSFLIRDHFAALDWLRARGLDESESNRLLDVEAGTMHKWIQAHIRKGLVG